MTENGATQVDRYHQALARQNQGQYPEAIAQYEEILIQYPQYAPAIYQLGVIMGNLGLSIILLAMQS